MKHGYIPWTWKATVSICVLHLWASADHLINNRISSTRISVAILTPNNSSGPALQVNYSIYLTLIWWEVWGNVYEHEHIIETFWKRFLEMVEYYRLAPVKQCAVVQWLFALNLSCMTAIFSALEVFPQQNQLIQLEPIKLVKLSPLKFFLERCRKHTNPN